MTTTLSDRADELTRSRVPFVRATVVRAQEPSSAQPGDRALILADGTLEGFVGGHCAAGSVRTAALEALDRGQSLLLRVLPDGVDVFPETPGATVVVNPCLSGGAVEIYLEPLLPSPVLHLVGTSPVARAVAELAPPLGFVLAPVEPEADPTGATVVIVATHGGDEAAVVRRALDAGVGFVGVVCSHTRGAVLLAELDLTEEEASRVHTHVGVEIGARTAPELGLSIMAAVVRGVRLEGVGSPIDGTARDGIRSEQPRQAVDPVCGMTVTIGPDTTHATVEGVEHWFCMPGCRTTYLAARVS